jgi:hypothetical protein
VTEDGTDADDLMEESRFEDVDLDRQANRLYIDLIQLG